ncbi:MAG TPA: phosphatase PAP2 family protein, partial [Dehalococcoidia bacterium]|nr:phosphatase PAP2 family protein [Dehalococcoidia bacterium]
NRFAQRSHVFDTSVVFLQGHDLMKGGVFMALLWWVWFRKLKPGEADKREYLVSALLMGIVAVGVARGLAYVLPFRERPFTAAGFHFIEPFGTDNSQLDTWSSFPSDHAVLFFALATGIFFASRPAGIFGFLYATFGICLPRLYLGIHWPTDIIAGTAIGVALGWLGAREEVRRLISRPALAWIDREPAWCYAGLFLLTYQMATLFNDSRDAVHFVLHTLKSIL